jgi:GNAT superfamily N-acetyltransferase
VGVEGAVTVAIRAYAEGDRDAVVTLVKTVLGEYGFAANIGGLERDLREVNERYAGQRAGFWVATMVGEIVGTVAIRPKDAKTCELKRLYLRADKRGVGLGQTLFAHAEAFARAAGYERIWLDSSRRFVKAHKLYVRNGFVLLESLQNDWEDDVFEKRLV